MPVALWENCFSGKTVEQVANTNFFMYDFAKMTLPDGMH